MVGIFTAWFCHYFYFVTFKDRDCEHLILSNDSNLKKVFRLLIIKNCFNLFDSTIDFTKLFNFFDSKDFVLFSS